MLGEWYLPPGESQVISTITEGTISISHSPFLSAQTTITQPPSLLADKSHALQYTSVRRSGGLSLPPRRLPAADLPLAFRLLAVALVPTPRLVFAPAPFAQADPRARSARSGLRAVVSLNVVGAHGSLNLPREKLGENAPAFSPGAIKTRTRRLLASLKFFARTRQRTKRF